MYLRRSKTTFFGRRIGYNEEKRKRTRAIKIKRGFKNVRRWFARRGWIMLAALVVIGVVAWNYRFYLQRFNPMELRHLQYIDIEGNRMLSWEDVVQNAQIETGMLMSEVNEDSVEKFLLRLPIIYKAQVKKQFPSSLSIKLQESSPIVASFATGVPVAYSERGLPLPVSAMSVFQLPIVEENTLEKMSSVSELLQVLRETNKSLYNQVSQIAWNETEKAYEIYFRDVGFKTLFPETNWDEKLFVLYESVKENFSQDLNCASEVDMRFSGFLYIRNFDKRCVNG